MNRVVIKTTHSWKSWLMLPWRKFELGNENWEFDLNSEGGWKLTIWFEFGGRGGGEQPLIYQSIFFKIRVEFAVADKLNKKFNVLHQYVVFVSIWCISIKVMKPSLFVCCYPARGLTVCHCPEHAQIAWKT